MAKSVEIGSGSFRTQKSALDHYKAVLHRYQDGQRVSKQDDHADLVALIERYDPVLDAVGEPTKGDGQIAHFERRLNTGTGWSSSGFWVVRQDGTDTDFSYIDAVKGQPKGRSQDFYGACRQAVALDLIQAKKQAFAQYVCIPRKLDTHSTPNWTLIPRQTGQSERSDAGLMGGTPRRLLGSSF